MTAKKYREEYASNKVKTVKDRVRNCLGCKKQFKTDKETFMCHSCGNYATRNGDYGV